MAECAAVVVAARLEGTIAEWMILQAGEAMQSADGGLANFEGLNGYQDADLRELADAFLEFVLTKVQLLGNALGSNRKLPGC